MNRKSQVWYIDFIVAIMIFVVGLTIYYTYVNNLNNIRETDLNEMIADAKAISFSLTSAGFPEAWNTTEVERIGLTNNDHRIDDIKFQQLNNLSYNIARLKLGTRFNYFIFFEDKKKCLINITNDYGIGNDAVEATLDTSLNQSNCTLGNPNLFIDTENIQNKKLVNINRIVAYRTEPVKMRLYVWE
jgi:hypothetical protein